MANEGGTWIMYGVEEDDPSCIHTVDQLMKYIEERAGVRLADCGVYDTGADLGV